MVSKETYNMKIKIYKCLTMINSTIHINLWSFKIDASLKYHKCKQKVLTIGSLPAASKSEALSIRNANQTQYLLLIFWIDVSQSVGKSKCKVGVDLKKGEPASKHV